MEEKKQPNKTQTRQSTLAQIIHSEDDDSQYGHLVDHLVESDTKPSKTDLWTRIFTRDGKARQSVSVHPIGADLIYDKSLRNAMSETVSATGEIVFSPFMISAEDLSDELSEKQLSLQELISLGQVATDAIARFSFVQEPSRGDIQHVPVDAPMDMLESDLQLKRGYVRKGFSLKQLQTAPEIHQMRESIGTKTIKRCQLSSTEIMSIIDTVLEDKLSHKEVGIKYNVTPRLVQSLVSGHRKQSDFISKIKLREEKRKFKLRSVIDHSLNALSQKEGFVKSDQVKSSLLQSQGLKVTNQYICSVLRHDLGMRYKPIRRVPFLGNSTRCLQLRMMYAKFMLRQYASRTRVINLDQTWVNETNFTRRKWRLRGQVNSSSANKVSPRLAMQMAICSEGRLYCSLAQVNTDQNTFCLLISKLATKLTEEDRGWRDRTILLIDGAKYQACKEPIRHMRALGFTVVISAPYSYSSAPIEYAFGFFKAGDLNPLRIKTGKKQVADLVHERLRLIDEQLIRKLFRHVIRYLYEYLIFKPL